VLHSSGAAPFTLRSAVVYVPYTEATGTAMHDGRNDMTTVTWDPPGPGPRQQDSAGIVTVL
jgi:hypothetical protein